MPQENCVIKSTEARTEAICKEVYRLFNQGLPGFHSAANWAQEIRGHNEHFYVYFHPVIE